MECPKCGGARSVCKCLWFSKESLDKALYPEKTLRDKITSLQARVKELEAQVLKYDEFWQKGDHPENAQLQKLVDMNQKVVDAARQYKKAAESRDMPEFKLERALFDAIDELDGVSNNDTNREKGELSK